MVLSLMAGLAARPPRPPQLRPVRPARSPGRRRTSSCSCRPTWPSSPRSGACPIDDLRLWVCLHEVAHHAVLGVPHVRRRAVGAAGRVRRRLPARAPTASRSACRRHRRSTTRRTSASLQSSFADPEVLLGAIRSDEQRALLPRLEALVAVVVGVVDWVMDEVGGDADRQLRASSPRRCAGGGSRPTPSDRFVEQLLGLELTRAAYERGSAVRRRRRRAGRRPRASTRSGATNARCRPPQRSTRRASGWPASSST